MSISRWKIMACSLGLSVAGLVAFAGPMNNRLNAQYGNDAGLPRTTEAPPAWPAGEKPVAQQSSSETLPPPAPTILPPVPTPTAPMAIFDPIPEANVQRPEYGIDNLPMPRQVAEQFEVPIEIVPMAPMAVAPVPMAVAPAQPIPVVLTPMSQPTPPAAPVEPIPLVSPYPVPAPIAQQPGVPAPPMPPMPTIRQSIYENPPSAAPPIQQAAANSTKLKMLVRLGDGKPRFEIRSSDSTDLLFKVYGEKVEMQSAPEGMKTSPIAGVCATGKVRFTGPGVEGTCDQLSVLSGTGEVLLKGNVCMKTKHGKSWSEVTAEKMIYQIGAEGLSTAIGTGNVRPASYNARD